MIAIDASALLAILKKEPEGEAFAACIASAGGGVISVVNFWEVLVRAEAIDGLAGREEAEALVQALGIDVVPATMGRARIAADAFLRYGRRTPANLNLGDCFAYALALEQGEGLLFKGEDFPRTDIKRVLP